MPSPRKYPVLFEESLAISTAVIRYCERNKNIDWLLAWLLSLLCSIVDSARSVRMLLQGRMVWDSLLICRKMNEAAFTIHYLLNNPGYAREMRRLYSLEIDIDGYKFLKVAAAREGKTLKELFLEKPDLAKIKKSSDVAQIRHEILTQANQSKRRGDAVPAPGRKPWRNISWQEKMAGLPLTRDAKKILEFTMHEGDAVAHLRPHYLRVFSYYDRARRFRFKFGPVSLRTLYFNPWTMPVLALLLGSDEIVDQYHLPKSLSKRIESVVADIKSHLRRNEKAASKKPLATKPASR